MQPICQGGQTWKIRSTEFPCDFWFQSSPPGGPFSERTDHGYKDTRAAAKC